MTGKTNPKPAGRLLAAELADLSMIPLPTMFAAAGISDSTGYEEIRNDETVQLLRFGPRCTRITIANARAWLIARAERGAADTQAAELTKARATRASAAAQAKRAAAAAAGR